MFCVKTEVMSIHKCKWSDSLVVRWQLTDQANPDRNLEKPFWKRCFLKTSVSNGIIYTKYTQNPHTIEPPFNIATQSATYTVTACVSRWEPNGLNANNPCPAARQKQYWYFISLLRFSALKCKPKGQKNVVVLENLIIESLHMIETEL